jgi:hypothetical protein
MRLVLGNLNLNIGIFGITYGYHLQQKATIWCLNKQLIMMLLDGRSTKLRLQSQQPSNSKISKELMISA